LLKVVTAPVLSRQVLVAHLRSLSRPALRRCPAALAPMPFSCGLRIAMSRRRGCGRRPGCPAGSRPPGPVGSSGCRRGEA
jgi:hypothetical protein